MTKSASPSTPNATLVKVPQTPQERLDLAIRMFERLTDLKADAEEVAQLRQEAEAVSTEGI